MNKGIFGLLAVLTILFNIAFAWAEEPDHQRNCVTIDENGTCILYEASIIELIANPWVWDGRKVRLKGYLKLKFEGNAIYLSKEDSDLGLSRNGLWVEVSEDLEKMKGQVSEKYVIIEGIFNARRKGHLGMWSGSIEKVSRVDTLIRQETNP